MNRVSNRLASLTPQRANLLFQALVALLMAAFWVRCMPFRRLAPRLGDSGRESALGMPEGQDAWVRDVEWAVHALARRMIPQPTCLMQAAAAKAILDWRGIPATVYLGVRPAAGDGRQVDAHAWLRCGSRIVTGKLEASRYSPLAWFS
jgi:hypothetical protein